MKNVKQRLEFRTDDSNKFWEIEVLNDKIDIYFGKIGTVGQKHELDFSEKEYNKRILEKLSKGYKPTKDTINALLDNSELEKPYIAIEADCLNEHVPDLINDDLCYYLTACIQNKMPPKKFRKIWDSFIDGDEELSDSLGKTIGITSNLDSPYWEDAFSGYGIGDLYKIAFEKKGDRFIWLDDNAFVNIVALRGDPGAFAIEKCVIDSILTETVTAGERKWPPKLDVGSPIANIQLASPNIIYLRNGQIIEIKE